MSNLALLGLYFGVILTVVTSPNIQADDTLDCAKLWSRGTPLAAHPSYPCRLFAEIPGHKPPTRIYWNASLGADTSALSSQDLEALIRLKQATLDTQPVYAAYGDSLPAAIIYTGAPSAVSRPAETLVGFNTPSEPVPVLIYTGLLKESDAYQKQTIAHELFHVFQISMRPYLVGFDEQNWWMEGTADFFSNLVYPHANREWENAEAYNQDEPLYAQSDAYSTTAFFQSFANFFWGPKGIVNMIQSMPKTKGAGVTDQWTAISEFASMDVHFDDFAKQFTLANIVDTGGGNLPTHYVDPNETQVPDAGLTENIIPVPFVIRTQRYALPSGKLWQFSGKSSDNKLKSSYLHVGQDKSWQYLFSGHPVSLDLSCDSNPHDIDVLVTSATGPTAPKSSFQVSFTPQNKECGCKPGADLPTSLVGRWLLRDSSMKDFMTTALAGAGVVDQVHGKMTAVISTSHVFSYQMEQLSVDYHRLDGTLVHIAMDGAGTQATAEAKDVTQMCLRQISSGVNAQITVTMPGHPPLSLDQPMSGVWTAGESYPISLTPTTLTVYRTFKGTQVPIIFDRI